MTSFSVLLILVGLFVIVNSPNFVGVFQGNKKLNLDLTPASADVPAVNASGQRSVGGSSGR